MADDDEIDVLGDFQLDDHTNLYDGTPLISQNSELLNCDYTIHPQWLLDRPSTNPDKWYDPNSLNEPDEKLEQDEEPNLLGHVSTENCITDESGWTEKEKGLLERGIEIFGKSSYRLSQFIGTRTAPEVRYYLKNFYLENHPSSKVSGCDLYGDVVNAAQIPASIEEVIAVVSTGKSTVQVPKSAPRKKTYSGNSSKDLSDKGIYEKNISARYKRKNKQSNRARNIKRNYKVNFDDALIRCKDKNKISSAFRCDKVNKVNRAEITTGIGLSVPICEGEEIVKLTKVEEDCDIEIDVDDEISDSDDIKADSAKLGKPKPIVTRDPNYFLNQDFDSGAGKVEKPLPTVNFNELNKLSKDILDQLNNLETPTSEICLDEDSITQLERVMHSEYFSDSSAKTAERYLQIRNHIILKWKSQKPKYLSKTISRCGFKRCGDVNSFGRVHQFLEQIGAINFGCEQVHYERPLMNLLKERIAAKEKKKEPTSAVAREGNLPASRVRIMKFNYDGDGGYTMSHDETGRIIKHTIVNEQAPVRQIHKKPLIELIYSKPFDPDKQPFEIHIDLATLLLMDFHAHTCMTEVMGLMAGIFASKNKILSIFHYEPCSNKASSMTHCDMCAVSQAEAAEAINRLGMEIVGWFHSHPTFAPEPSHLDLETQVSVQKWIGQDNPCIGMILSPFNPTGALIASPYRCIMAKLLEADKMVPFKFKVKVQSGDFSLDDLFEKMKNILYINRKVDVNERVKFDEPYFQNSKITHLEKYISSVKMHVANVGYLEKDTRQRLIRGIRSLCEQT